MYGRRDRSVRTLSGSLSSFSCASMQSSLPMMDTNTALNAPKRRFTSAQMHPAIQMQPYLSKSVDKSIQKV